MKFTKRLEYLFVLVTLTALCYMGYNWYVQKNFEDNPLSERVQQRIQEAQQKVLEDIYTSFGLRVQIPLIVSKEFDSRLYGLTSYKDGQIAIYLNKKRFKESETYMLEEVIPHEYAHAMHFILEGARKGDGHTQRWQEICRKLDGIRCERYVDNEDIVRQKMGW